MPKTVSGDQGSKRCPLNMRTTPDLRKQLEAAALASGRSLVQEVEYRLQRSFDQQAWTAEVLAQLKGTP